MKTAVNMIDRKNLARAVRLLNSPKTKGLSQQAQSHLTRKERDELDAVDEILDVPSTMEMILDWATEKTSPLSVSEAKALRLLDSPTHNVPISSETGRAHRMHIVNAMLRQCLVFPQFANFRRDGGAIVRWLPDPRFGVVGGAIGERQRRKADAILLVVSLAERGLLYRLRQCEREDCGRWFEGPEKKKFHSLACRKRAFLESDRGKEWRKEYQKKYMADMRREEKEEDKEFFESEQALRSKAGERKRRSQL